MTNPTREEIISAHEALETLCARVLEDTPVYAMKILILAALPPKPQPTMADVGWDNDKHYLAEAEHDVYGQVIMLGLDAGGLIEFIIPSRRDFRCDTDSPGTLTPTGKRYTLTEVQE